MKFKVPHLAIVAGTVCMAVALLFHLIGLGGAGWTVYGTSSIGLWKTCGASSCTDIPEVSVSDALRAVRAFALIGLFIIIGCLVVSGLIFFMDKKMLPMIAMELASAAALCLMIEFAVYAGQIGGTSLSTYLYTTTYGYSFALTIVAFLLCLASGICFYLPKYLVGGFKIGGAPSEQTKPNP